MQYLLLIYDDEARWQNLPAAELEKMYADYGRLSQSLEAAGAMRGGAELQPVASASTVRVRKGKVLTTDGPFAETKEQLGGFYLIDVPDLDAALKWAAQIPSADGGAIEVRPLVERDRPAQG